MARKSGWLFLLVVPLAAWRGSSQSTVPGLRIALSTNADKVILTVTNRLPNAVYDIFWTQFLYSNSMPLTNLAWVPKATGATNQTNFIMPMYGKMTGFFRALNTNDFDGDGALNVQDARMYDPFYGLMTVTIESPTNNAIVP